MAPKEKAVPAGTGTASRITFDSPHSTSRIQAALMAAALAGLIAGGNP